MFLSFPSFNLFSTPLLVLVSQGIIFGLLLLQKFKQKKKYSFLFLSLLVLITCYHRTTYTIGFMDWYDTYRNTKINYWLINFSLAIGPLIFFYVKSITNASFKFGRKDFVHFVPALIYFLYRAFIFIYDAGQEGFENTQNGLLMSKLEMGATTIFIEAFGIIQQLLYLAFSLQLYFNYRTRLQDFFSNTYRMELNWIRNFLYIYTFLFVYMVIQQLINLSVLELSWIQRWWYQLFSALAVIYVGIKGYFTDTSTLSTLQFNPTKQTIAKEGATVSSLTDKQRSKEEIETVRNQLLDYMSDKKPYLDPELNLKQLSEQLNLTRSQLSEVINAGFGKNFNDFINEYRIEAVKQMLQEGQQNKLSLLGIAFDCGFNSKATFNRVFKKLNGTSPTEFLRNK